MKRRVRYYIWNKISDFGTGFAEHIDYTDNGLSLRSDASGNGWYHSRVIDSQEAGKKWSRAEMKSILPLNTSAAITFYASESNSIRHDQNIIPVEKLLTGSALTQQQREALFPPYSAMRFQNMQDMMLSQLEGRYLWFSVQLQGEGSNLPQVQQIRIWLDSSDWLSYLPEVYQEDAQSADFTARFLGIFQNLHEEMTEKIRTLPVCYDPECTSRDFLEWMACWIGLQDNNIWSDAQLRKLLQCGADLFRRTGTVGMLREITEIYTGFNPIIIENFLAPDIKSAVQAWRTGKYPRQPFGFTVILPADAVKTQSQHKALLQILTQYKPAHMQMQLLFTDSLQNEETLPQTISLTGRTALMQGENT